jgi:hypothetical protein
MDKFWLTDLFIRPDAGASFLTAGTISHLQPNLKCLSTLQSPLAVHWALFPVSG